MANYPLTTPKKKRCTNCNGTGKIELNKPSHLHLMKVKINGITQKNCPCCKGYGTI